MNKRMLLSLPIIALVAVMAVVMVGCGGNNDKKLTWENYDSIVVRNPMGGDSWKDVQKLLGKPTEKDGADAGTYFTGWVHWESSDGSIKISVRFSLMGALEKTQEGLAAPV